MRSAALVLVVLGLSGMALADRELPPADPRIGTWDGRTQSAELAGRYEDRLQQEIPFGARSYYLSPWRAYMDTWPAGRFLECLGINFNVEEKEAEAAAEVLGQAGMRSARVEIGWGNFLYEDPSRLPDHAARRLTAVLGALRQHRIRPLILLNANSGHPCPVRITQVRLLRSVPVGAREVVVDRTADIRPGYTGLRGMAYPMAFPLITRVDRAAGRCQLSAPCPKALPEGPLELATLKYQPFAGAAFADGSPNRAARETLDGWRTYVAAVCRFARSTLGTNGADDAGFDLEVWNEYSFGSQFLEDKNYYNPPRAFKEPLSYSKHGLTRTGYEVILPVTVDYVNDPASRLPGVGVLSGFANQRPWDSGTDLWPGQTGFSRHYYTNLNPGRWDGQFGLLSPETETESNRKETLLDALGQREGQPFFIPTLTVALPEAWHYGYKTEFLTRDVQPFPGPWKLHHRYSHPGTGRPAQVWMSEFNLSRQPWADALVQRAHCAPDDPRLAALMHHVGARALLRSFVFHAHKGVHTVNVFAARGGDTALGVLPEVFFKTLTAEDYHLKDRVRAQVGPQLTVLGRVTRLMRTGKLIEEARPVSVRGLVEHRPRLVFKGEGTRAHPDRWQRDDFACLPFQLEADRFAVACYVVTRNLSHDWDARRDLLDPARYDMPEQTFDLTLGNVRGKGGQVSAWDPVTDRTIPVKVLASGRDTLSVRLAVVDYPRFLLLQEDRPGPLVLAPRLRIERAGQAEVRFRINGKTGARLSWGLLPERMGDGSVKLPAAAEHRYTIPHLSQKAGVRVVVERDGLVARWPRWGYDVAGVFWGQR